MGIQPILDFCKKFSKIICISIIILISLIILLIVLLLLFGGVKPIKDDYYQDIKTNFPIENKYRILGKYEVENQKYKISDKQYKEIVVYYPKNIKDLKIKFPIVVMANGTGVPYNKYIAIFKHLASWGFIVIGNDHEWSYSGESTIYSLNYIKKFNDDSNSIFYNKLDLDNIGVAGHSQGGVSAIHTVYNFTESSLFKTIYAASPTGKSFIKNLKLEPFEYDISKIKIPILMLAATGKTDSNSIIPLEDLQYNYNNLTEGVPAVIGRRKNCDHGDMLIYGDPYMTAWFCYLLKSDDEAKDAFVGSKPEIYRNNDNWQDVQFKGFNIIM